MMGIRLGELRRAPARRHHSPDGRVPVPKDVIQPPREWAVERYRDLRMWHELDRGGHFAAFEQPELFAAEVREFFDGLE